MSFEVAAVAAAPEGVQPLQREESTPMECSAAENIAGEMPFAGEANLPFPASGDQLLEASGDGFF